MTTTEQDLTGVTQACAVCTDPDDGSSDYPMYGAAPHECYWRKGPEYMLGQSTLLPITPDDCFVPDLEQDETWADFQYPSATGVFYCPACQQGQYEAAWNALIARIGRPPQETALNPASIGDEG